MSTRDTTITRRPPAVASTTRGRRDAAPIVHDALRSSGQPLDATTRAFMEPRLGHDFGHVRVHTDARAAEAADAVDALAYTIGADVVFAAGQYAPRRDTGRRLIAHELAHVIQQQHHRASASRALTVGRADDADEREADRVAEAVAHRDQAIASVSHTPSPGTLQRQPKTTQVRVDATGWTSITMLNQGKGTSGAVVYEYPAVALKAPPDGDLTKKATPIEIKLPLLVYPPAVVSPPKVDLFVFFHGMRADYGEGGGQGWEPIALWTQLEQAVTGSGRVGIAPQGPKTARIVEVDKKDPADPAKTTKVKEWGFTTAQWHEALGNIGFDGLIKIALDRLSRDLELSTPLVAGDIHVAGHSAGGQGIVESITQGSRTKTLADQVQDITLQDAGYGDTWSRAVDWLLDGSPGKTMRVLLSQGEGGRGATRKVLLDVNPASVKAAIAKKGKDADLEVVEQPVTAAKDQKPRPGGFVLEQHFIVKNKMTGAAQGTVVVFFAPFAPKQGHYETATATMRAAAVAGPKTTADFLGEAKPGKFRVISADAPLSDDKTLANPLMAAAARGRGRAVVLDRNTEVEVTALELLEGAPLDALRKKSGDPVDTPRYVAKVKSPKGEGWTLLARLAPLP